MLEQALHPRNPYNGRFVVAGRSDRNLFISAVREPLEYYVAGDPPIVYGTCRCGEGFSAVCLESEGGGFGWAHRKALQLIALYGDVCAYCSVPLTDRNRTVDHVQPRARGGRNHLANLALSCSRCNHLKKDRCLADWKIFLAEFGEALQFTPPDRIIVGYDHAGPLLKKKRPGKNVLCVSCGIVFVNEMSMRMSKCKAYSS